MLKVHVHDDNRVEIRKGRHFVTLGPDATVEAYEAAAHLLVEKVAGFSSADGIAAVSLKLFGMAH